MNPYRDNKKISKFILGKVSLVDILEETNFKEVLLYTGRSMVTVGTDFAEELDELNKDLGVLYAGINITGRDMDFSKRVKKILDLKSCGIIDLSKEDSQFLSSDGLVLQAYCVSLEKGVYYNQTEIWVNVNEKNEKKTILSEPSMHFNFPTYL